MSYPRSCEQVRSGHPDKLCDQIADSILDYFLDVARKHGLSSGDSAPAELHRAGLEVLAKGNTVVLSGEVRVPEVITDAIDYETIVRNVFVSSGYDNATELRVVDLIGNQQPELQASSDRRGAGDQGIMIGYATDETPEMMPVEFSYATKICRTLDSLMGAAGYHWLRPDGKAQVIIDRNGKILKVVIGVQHSMEVNGVSDGTKIQALLKMQILEELLMPMFGKTLDTSSVIINGTGSFTIGGPAGDAGVVGRKIVCDAYGPNVAVGGGAFSGKDPTKVDRSAAYMARYMAKSAVRQKIADAKAVTVRLAYAIGSIQPEMIYATTESGRNITAWAKSEFPDLSPSSIAERFDLWRKNASTWKYSDTSRYGHFGRNDFPWEKE